MAVSVFRTTRAISCVLGMHLRLMRGVFSNTNEINLILMIFPRMSLTCKLVPVQNREYDYELLRNALISVCTNLSNPVYNRGLLSWKKLVGFSVLNGICWGSYKTRPTLRLVSFRVFFNFSVQHSRPFNAGVLFSRGIDKTESIKQHACKTSAHGQGLYFQNSGCECELHNKNAFMWAKIELYSHPKLQSRKR